jgi:hypothetical protein
VAVGIGAHQATNPDQQLADSCDLGRAALDHRVPVALRVDGGQVYALCQGVDGGGQGAQELLPWGHGVGLPVVVWWYWAVGLGGFILVRVMLEIGDDAVCS